MLGGWLLIAYRGPVGLDGLTLAEHEKSRVQIMIGKYDGGPAAGKGSDLMAALAARESYYVRWNGLAIVACATSTDGVNEAVGGGTPSACILLSLQPLSLIPLSLTIFQPLILSAPSPQPPLLPSSQPFLTLNSIPLLPHLSSYGSVSAAAPSLPLLLPSRSSFPLTPPSLPLLLPSHSSFPPAPPSLPLLLPSRPSPSTVRTVATVGVAMHPIREEALSRAQSQCPAVDSPPPPPPAPPTTCGCDEVTIDAASSSVPSAVQSASMGSLLGAVWVRHAGEERWSAMLSTTKYYLVKCADTWYVTSADIHPASDCNPNTGSVIAKSSAASTAVCPTDATGWEMWGGGAYNSVSAAAVACTCSCNHISLAGAENDQPLAMTLFSRNFPDPTTTIASVNGRPVYASANDKKLFYDGTRWRVADSTSTTSGGEVQSAATSNFCPNEASGWTASVDGVFGSGPAVSAACDCPCDTLSVLTSSKHTLGSDSGAVVYERVHGVFGEGGRPVYQDYGGQCKLQCNSEREL